MAEDFTEAEIKELVSSCRESSKYFVTNDETEKLIKEIEETRNCDAMKIMCIKFLDHLDSLELRIV